MHPHSDFIGTLLRLNGRSYLKIPQAQKVLVFDVLRVTGCSMETAHSNPCHRATLEHWVHLGFFDA